MNTELYAAPWWLPGGNAQTIYARILARNYSQPYRRQRWETPDGDFIDLDWTPSASESHKLLVLFHGLEGCSRSHYALSLMSFAQRQGWGGVVPHFRGCSGEMNRLARSYHSGDSAEIDWILRRVKSESPDKKIYAAGVSLGGNMLLKWLGEQKNGAAAIIDGAVAISAPVDLNAAAAVLDAGYRRAIYTRHFLGSICRKVLVKISQHRLEIDPAAVRASQTFRQIDDLYTAPVHGFKSAEDYWTRASSKPLLREIAVPTLLLNAGNDPFLPSSALPNPDEISSCVTLNLSQCGGHVGFVGGHWPGHLDWLASRVLSYFSTLE